MPTLSRALVRTGLLYLIAALLLAVGEPWLSVPAPVLRPTWIHLLVLGWLTQLIFGVAHWMFPRYSAEHPRGHEALGWTGFAALNAGLLMRTVAEPLLRSTGQGGSWLPAAALLQLLGVALFVIHLWPRLKVR